MLEERVNEINLIGVQQYPDNISEKQKQTKARTPKHAYNSESKVMSHDVLF